MVRDSATLKSFLETGDKPSQSQWGDLVDTIENILGVASATYVSLLAAEARIVLLEAANKIVYATMAELQNDPNIALGNRVFQILSPLSQAIWDPDSVEDEEDGLIFASNVISPGRIKVTL